jgi:hypothetical protein
VIFMSEQIESAGPGSKTYLYGQENKTPQGPEQKSPTPIADQATERFRNAPVALGSTTIGSMNPGETRKQ